MPTSSTYSHRLKGTCPCGVEHNPADPKPSKSKAKSTRYVDYDHAGRSLRLPESQTDLLPSGLVRLNVLDQAGGKIIDKTFNQHHWDGAQWKIGLGPYASDASDAKVATEGGAAFPGWACIAIASCWPPILNRPVWIVEGEKDVERLETLGLLSCTNLGGAVKWKDRYSEVFKGRHCLLIPDNDAKDSRGGKDDAHGKWPGRFTARPPRSRSWT